MSWIAAGHGQSVDPDKINPYKRPVVVEREPSPNQNAIAWRVFDDFMSGGKRRGKRNQSQ